MNTPLVLTFDVGTQSTRAVLVDKEGNIVFKVQEEYDKPYFSKNTDWAEQRADFYWDAVCEASKSLKEKAGERWEDIIAVTVTTIRDTTLCIDEKGTPVRDVVVWLDKRKAVCSRKIPAIHRALFKLVKMTDTINLQREISTCNWIIENEPEVWAKTKHMVFLSCYINFRLTGNIIDADASTIGHQPFDNKSRSWMKKGDLTRGIFEIEDEKLYPLAKPESELGRVTAEAAAATGVPEGIPLIATGSDKGCETLGLAVLDESKAAISFGTTATVQLMTHRYVEPQSFLPAYAAVIDGCYNPEIQIYRGYWLVSWFKKEFAEKEVRQAKELGVSAESLLDRRLREIPAGCEGLILQPYFTPGVSMPNARGAIIGFSDVHTRIHIYRAIIEGINFSLYEGIRQLEKRTGVKVTELRLGGGGSRSAEICQITADMFGLPVVRTQTHEACGVGGAMIAFRALGHFKDYSEAAASMVRERDRFEPNMEQHEIYEDIFNSIYTKIFDKLAPLYKISAELGKKRGE